MHVCACVRVCMCVYIYGFFKNIAQELRAKLGDLLGQNKVYFRTETKLGAVFRCCGVCRAIALRNPTDVLRHRV
jgi:hypothetical protein